MKYNALENRSKELLMSQGSAVSGASVALSGLGSRLELLVEQLITSYNISEQDLEVSFIWLWTLFNLMARRTCKIILNSFKYWHMLITKEILPFNQTCLHENKVTHVHRIYHVFIAVNMSLLFVSNAHHPCDCCCSKIIAHNWNSIMQSTFFCDVGSICKKNALLHSSTFSLVTSWQTIVNYLLFHVWI